MKEHNLESEERTLGLNILSPLVDETWLFAEDEPIFKTKHISDNVALSFILVLSPDRMVHKRAIYSFLDWLGDVGGLLEGLRLVGQIGIAFVTLFISNPLSAFLVNALFKSGSVVDETESAFDGIKKRQKF